jgi:hypothetical protein
MLVNAGRRATVRTPRCKQVIRNFSSKTELNQSSDEDMHIRDVSNFHDDDCVHVTGFNP